MKIFFVASLLLALMVPAVYAGYPAQSTETRYVNDFAGILSKEEAQKLNNELKDYNIKTTNDVVVVTVKSLEGMSVEKYTLGLANTWGIGKTEKDNGVVLLVAPEEGEVRIEVGIGLENILTQKVTDNILDEKVMPYLQDGQISEGIISGARSIMQNIDQRSSGSEQEELVQTSTIDEGAGKILIYFLVLMVVVIVISLLVSRAKEKSRSKKEVLERLKECEETKLHKLMDYHNEATVKLDLIKKDNPRSVWESLESAFKAISFGDLGERVSGIRMKYSDKSLNLEEIGNMLSILEKDIDRHIGTCKEIESLQAKIKNAKEDSVNLLKKLPGEMNKAESLVAHPDVFPETKASFDSTKAMLQMAQKKFEGSPNEINWLSASSELNNLEKDLNEIQYKAESNKAACERARKEGPQLLNDLPTFINETEKEFESSEDYLKLTMRARNEYDAARNMGGVSELEMYLRLIAIRESLDHARRDRKEKIQTQKRETEERIAKEKRSRSYNGSGRGGSFGGGGSSRTISRSSGGSFSGSGSSRSFKK